MRKLLLPLSLLALLLPASAMAKVSGSRASSRSTSSRSSPRAKSARVRSSSVRCASCSRNEKGRIARSAAAKRSFEKSHPCPSTGKSGGACPGYVVDHVTPLKRGGPDAPSNMQWQTTAEAKAKDRVE
jgi:hypothetical protein